MKDWNLVLANAAKDKTSKAKRQATEEASAFVGTLESLAPLMVSILDGEFMYDAEDIIVSKTFDNYEQKLKTPGTKLLIMPMDGLDTICLMDIIT